MDLDSRQVSLAYMPTYSPRVKSSVLNIEYSHHDSVSLRNEWTRSDMEAGAIQERQAVRHVYCNGDMVSL